MNQTNGLTAKEETWNESRFFFSPLPPLISCYLHEKLMPSLDLSLFDPPFSLKYLVRKNQCSVANIIRTADQGIDCPQSRLKYDNNGWKCRGRQETQELRNENGSTRLEDVTKHYGTFR